MATEILKEFLVAVGFKVDEASYKKQADAVDKVGKQLNQIDRDDRDRVTSEGRRHEVRKRNAEGLALALGGVATAAAAAATVVGAAMVKIAGGFDNLYFVSQRTGASVNQIKGLSYAFSQVGSSAESAMQAVESFAKSRRTNPGIDGMLRSLGVDTRGDSVDVLLRGIDAAQARHPYHTGAQIAAQFGISEDQYQTLTKYREEIRKFREEYKRTQLALNVDSDETARSSATIQRAIGSLTATLGVLTEKLYTALAPVLERIVKGFKDWIESHPEQVEKIMQGIAQAVETVGNGLIRLGDWLGDEENQKRLAAYWDKFLTAVKETAKQVKDLLEMLFKIGRYLGLGSNDDPIGKLATRALGNQPQVGEGDGSAGQTYTPLLQRGLNAVKRTLGIGGGGGENADLTAKPGSKADIRGKTFDAKAPGVMKRLMEDFGLSKDEAAIVLGNLGHESAGFTAFEEGGNGPGRGWAQWTDPGRKARFFKYARDNKLDPKSDEANYGFLKWELENTHKSSIDNLKRARGNDEKMRVFERDFEGARIKAYGSRNNYARRAREAYDRANKAPSSPPPSERPAPPAAPAPKAHRTPGDFNVDDYLKTQPMGSTSNNTNNSKSVSQNNPVTVNVQGATDPQATGSAVARAMGQVNDMSLRNVQTAIR